MCTNRKSLLKTMIKKSIINYVFNNRFIDFLKFQDYCNEN